MHHWRAKATASSMERTSHCPAWVGLAENLPEEPEKPYATEGTDLHLDVHRALECGTRPEDRDVRFCVDEVWRTLPARDCELHLEERLPFCGTSGGLDCYALDRYVREAYLFDFKFGMGVRVVAKNNEQIASYMVALKDKYPWIRRIHAKVIQPRISGEDFDDCPSVTHWTLPFQTIAAWKRRINGWLDEVEEGKRMSTGPGCRFCPVRPVCPLHRTTAAEVCKLPAIKESNMPVDIARLAAMLSKREQVESWFNKLNEYLETLALQGVEVPGFELRKKRANRVWHEMMEEEELAEKLIEAGVPEEEVWKPRQLISPAQAEKLAESDVSMLWQKPEGGLALRPIK